MCGPSSSQKYRNEPNSPRPGEVERRTATRVCWNGPRGAEGGETFPAHLRGTFQDSPAAPLPRAQSVDRILRGTTITGREDEEKRRTLPQVSGKGQKTPPREQSKGGRPSIGRGASLTSRAGALAQGYQPAVVKVVSYAHGAARASATANYVDRDDAVLETHEGVELKGREAINAEIAAWANDFEQRAESQDVSAVRLHVAGLKDNDADRAILKQAVEAAFKGHSYAYRIETLQNGAIETRAVVASPGLPSSPQPRAKSPRQSN